LKQAASQALPEHKPELIPSVTSVSSTFVIHSCLDPPSECSRREWKRLRRLVDNYKHYRHQLYVAYLVRRPARGGDLSDAIRRIRAADAILTVAFNAPQKIEMQAALVRAFVPNAVYVVLDHSSDDRGADEIKSVARAQNVAYVRLPPAPWRDAQGSHGHALAILPDYNSDECGIQWFGDWLHESHFKNLRQDLQDEKERAVRKRLQLLLRPT
jgi:hypothetical protein